MLMLLSTGLPNKYFDRDANPTIEKTLIKMHPVIVWECAPPVDFLMMPTPKKISMLSYQKSNNMPITDISVKIVAICSIAVKPYAITALLFSS